MHVVAGDYHTVLVQSNGRVVACGENSYGQCVIPALEEDLFYMADVSVIMVNATYDGSEFQFRLLDGELLYRIDAGPRDFLSDIQKKLAGLNRSRWLRFEAIFADGTSLSEILSRDSSASVSVVCTDVSGVVPAGFHLSSTASV